MNDEQLVHQLDLLKAKGTTAKVALLTDLLEQPKARAIIHRALDPFTLYYVNAKFKVLPGPCEFDNRTFDLLDNLSSRAVTGQAAKSALEQELRRISYEGQDLLWRVLQKDLRCGVGASLVNRARPGFVEMFRPMLAEKYKGLTTPSMVETKWDGVRAIMVCMVEDANCSVTITSRTGKPLPGVSFIAEDIAERIRASNLLRGLVAKKGGLVLDGELDSPAGFNAVVGDVRRLDRQAEGVVFKMFDSLPLPAFKEGQFLSPLEMRMRVMGPLTEAIDSPHLEYAPGTYCTTDEEVQAVYRAAREQGAEGVVVKPLDGPYLCKRCKSWQKIKDQQSVDIPVVAMQEGTGKYQGMLGALIGDLDGKEVSVGTGITDAERVALWRDRDQQYGRIMEVEYHERTPDGSLRHPRFKTWRDDKSAEDGPGV